MSAFVVSDKHILYLTNYANITGVSFGWNGAVVRLDNVETLNWIARELLRTNVDAVNYRYAEQDTPHELIWTPLLHQRFDPVQVLKACRCYECQACELPTYDSTVAHRFIEELMATATSDLPGYNQADWEII